MMPVPVIPPQDVSVWVETLQYITQHRHDYERVARESRAAALAHVKRQTVDALDNYLHCLKVGGLHGGGRAAEPAGSRIQL